MALALTRAMGRMSLVATTPRLLTTPSVVVATQRPRFSFAQSVAGRPIQTTEFRSVSFTAFSTRCSKSAEKRHRQSEKRRARNKSRKSEVKTRMKRVLSMLDGFDKEAPKAMSELDSVEPLMRKAFKAIDKAVQKGTLHKNTGARRKSRLCRAKTRLLIKSGLLEPIEKPKPPSLLEEYLKRKQARRDALKQRIQEQL